MSHIDLLSRLQHVDDEISQKKQRFGEILHLQKDTSALEAARKAAKTAADELQKWRSQQKVLNLELQALNDKAKRSEDRLYSGLVKNPKELTDLQSEIDSLNRRRGGLEDELLETMIMFEEAQEENDSAASDLAQIESDWNTAQAAFKVEQSDLVQRINELTQIRKEQAEAIPAKFLAAYDHVAKRGHSPAVATLKNNRCRVCLVTVPANLVKTVNEGQLVYCDNCGRILSPA